VLWVSAGAVSVASAADAVTAHQFSGDVRLNYYQASKDLAARDDDVGVTAEAEIQSNWTDRFTSKAVVRWHVPDLGDTSAKAELREGYGLWRGDRLGLKIGKQIVAWGRADGVNPTDNLTPRNYRVQLPFDDDQRSGVLALKADYFVEAEKTFSLFLSPDFEPSKMPLPLGVQFSERHPAVGRWPLGVKWDEHGERTDWSVSYFRGYKLLPEWRAGVADGIVDFHYPKISVFGADTAINFGRFGWRAEFAHVTRDEPQARGSYGGNWSLVTGFDRSFDQELNVNLQGIVQRNSRPGDVASIVNAGERNIAEANAVAFNQESRWKFGATMRIGKKWRNGTVEAELLMIEYFRPSTNYWRPMLNYAVSDSTKLTVGAELFRGPSNSFFGANKRLQGLFGELRFFY